MKHYLLKITIQDGERTYTEYTHVTTTNGVAKMVDNYNTSETKVKDHYLKEITKEQYCVLSDLGVV